MDARSPWQMVISVRTERGDRMSVSKWAYSPDKCDGNLCPGDCDNCSKAEEEDEL